jgi:hypothetical protein
MKSKRRGIIGEGNHVNALRTGCVKEPAASEWDRK